MKRLLKLLAIGLTVLALAVATLLTLAWWSSERALRQSITVADPELPSVDAAGVAQGRHLYRSRGCSDCHGENGEGRVVFDAPPFRMVSSNLTPAGKGRDYDADAFGRAIRHGVAHDGRVLKLMPVIDYAELSDADTAALAAYLATLDPVEHDPGESRIHLLGRVLHLFGHIDLAPGLQIDHAPRERAAPVASATVEYGTYIAKACRGCHGVDYRGQRVPGTPPEFPAASDLTALDGWQREDFSRVLREGIRPDGRLLHPLMPWKAFRTLTEDEITAMWLYFSGL